MQTSSVLWQTQEIGKDFSHAEFGLMNIISAATATTIRLVLEDIAAARRSFRQI
jgi:hypothetical protein